MSDRYPSDWASRRKRVLRRDNYTCQNCGVQGGPHGNVELHVHHSVPVSKGGTHQLSNLITHCDSCHDAIHTNSMAPTATSSPRSHDAPDIEVPGFAATVRVMCQAAIFLMLVSAAGGWGIPLFIGYYVLFKHLEHKISNDSEDSSSDTGSNQSSMTPSGGFVSTSTRNLGADQSPSVSTSSRDDNELDINMDGYDPNRDPYAWDETLSSDSGSSETESDNAGNQPSSDQVPPFDWYGDDEVPVETVLEYVYADLDPDTREVIKQSVEKHRNRGDAVDAADIRWIAEASEKMDLESDHPF